MLSEASRERALHRYYQPWLDARSLVDVPREAYHEGDVNALTYSGYKPQSSRDKALTAFAQLAALRLNVRRAMVSLIDSKQQYILAEATKTLSLVSDDRYGENDEIWLGNTILERAVAVDPYVFSSTYTARDENGRELTADALVVPDMREDDRFKDRDYVKAKPGVLFYAGVPIKTKTNHVIGVYAVSHDAPRFGLTASELQFMQDVAATVMEHLEMAKDRDDRQKGEKMVRGLARFIEGMSAVETMESTNATSLTAEDNPLDGNLPSASKLGAPSSATLARQTENARIEDPDAPADAGPRRSPSNSSRPPSWLPVSPPPITSTKAEDDVSRVFYRAAKIIRESTLADGVVFFGTVAGNVKGDLDVHTASPNEMSDDSQTSDSGFSSANTHGLKASTKAPLPKIHHSQGNASSESAQNANQCEIIGLSLDKNAPHSSVITEKQLVFLESSMERYIKRYPHGKYFSFTDNGSGISSGDERSETELVEAAKLAMSSMDSARADKKKRKRRESFIPTEVLRILPGVRNLIFLPLWDAASEKWIAGGFIWASNHGRLISPENELPYLKAFGNSIMSEMARVNALKADRAKTTFIASISHELRSPLHGILGSVEFLQDTDTTPYQAGLITSVETCGKTLLDTIDHVLDYAKINKLRRSNVRKRHESHARISHNIDSSSVLGPAAEFDLGVLVEEVVEAVCAGHAFRKSQSGVFLEGSIRAKKELDPTSASADPGLTLSTHDNVDIILDISPHTGWTVRSQPGALRRIVMNLLGNALKYTPAGFAAVYLHARSHEDASGTLDFTLRFVDSGKGMSLEYQRTKLFSPFSQEDPFAVGTGLGLSIVRQIVESLNGSIHVKSDKDVGTEIEVRLSLPAVPDKHNEINEIVLPVLMATRTLRLGVIAPSHTDRVATSVRRTCENWFGMTVEEVPTINEATGDLLLIVEGYMTIEDIIRSYDGTRRPPPMIVVSHDASRETLVKANSQVLFESHGISAEVISQPVGPVKVAHILQKILPYVPGAAHRPTIPRSTTSPANPSSRASPVTTSLAPPHPEISRSASEIPYSLHTRNAETSNAGHPPVPGSPLIGTSPPRLEAPQPRIAIASPTSPINLPERVNAAPATFGIQAITDAAEAATKSADAAATVPALASSHIAQRAAQPEPPVLEPKDVPHVLLVDDNPINLQLLVMFMKKCKFSYVEATNGVEAVEAYRKSLVPPETDAVGGAPPSPPPPPPPPAQGKPPRRFDYILMDISMPIMDGLEATRRIRRIEASAERERAKTAAGLGEWRRVRIIALTGLASAQAQEEAMGSGVDTYLAKPVKFGELKKILK